MAYDKKTWQKRIVTLPGGRIITDQGDGTVVVTRADGDVIQEGDGYTIANMNDFEDRVEAGLDEKLDIANLANNATTTEEGLALDAQMGKTLQDQITSVVEDYIRNNAIYITRATVSYANVNALSTSITIPSGIFASVSGMVAIASHEWNTGSVSYGYDLIAHTQVNSVTSVQVIVSSTSTTFETDSTARVVVVIIGTKAS